MKSEKSFFVFCRLLGVALALMLVQVTPYAQSIFDANQSVGINEVGLVKTTRGFAAPLHYRGRALIKLGDQPATVIAASVSYAPGVEVTQYGQSYLEVLLTVRSGENSDQESEYQTILYYDPKTLELLRSADEDELTIYSYDSARPSRIKPGERVLMATFITKDLNDIVQEEGKLYRSLRESTRKRGAWDFCELEESYPVSGEEMSVTESCEILSNNGVVLGYTIRRVSQPGNEIFEFVSD